MQVTISGMEGTIPASWLSHLEIAIERSNPSLSARIKSLYETVSTTFFAAPCA